jgi:thioredoxin 1
MAQLISVTDETFEEEVVKSQVDTIAVFWAGHPNSYRELFLTLKKLALEYKDRLKIVTIEFEKNPRTISLYGVSLIPTIFAFINGSPIIKICGDRSKSDLMKMIELMQKDQSGKKAENSENKLYPTGRKGGMVRLFVGLTLLFGCIGLYAAFYPVVIQSIQWKAPFFIARLLGALWFLCVVAPLVGILFGILLSISGSIFLLKGPPEPLTESVLTNTTWQYGSRAFWSLSETIKLLPGGTIILKDDTFTWSIKQNKLLFHNFKGNWMASFNRFRKKGGKWLLGGQSFYITGEAKTLPEGKKMLLREISIHSKA